MNKEAILKEVYETAYNDELKKHAGVGAEALGTILNPISAAVAIPAVIAGMVGKGKSKKDLEKMDEKTWSNILIPGAAPYRLGKRIISA